MNTERLGIKASYLFQESIGSGFQLSDDQSPKESLVIVGWRGDANNPKDGTIETGINIMGETTEAGITAQMDVDQICEDLGFNAFQEAENCRVDIATDFGPKFDKAGNLLEVTQHVNNVTAEGIIKSPFVTNIDAYQCEPGGAYCVDIAGKPIYVSKLTEVVNKDTKEIQVPKTNEFADGVVTSGAVVLTLVVLATLGARISNKAGDKIETYKAHRKTKKDKWDQHAEEVKRNISKSGFKNLFKK